MSDKDMNCLLMELVDRHGTTQCYDYAADKCEALAKAVRCGNKDFLQTIAKAQVGLLLVQMSLTKRHSVDCLVDNIEKVIKNLMENNSDETTD